MDAARQQMRKHHGNQQQQQSSDRGLPPKRILDAEPLQNSDRGIFHGYKQ